MGRQFAGPAYPDVMVNFIGNTVYAFDGIGTTPLRTVALAFQDLVGQPTWIDPFQITFPTVLRGDINVGDQVTFPTGVMTPYALTQPGDGAGLPNTPSASQSAFQGTFRVNEVHHYARFREPDAKSWNTTFKANFFPNAAIATTS